MAALRTGLAALGAGLAGFFGEVLGAGALADLALLAFTAGFAGFLTGAFLAGFAGALAGLGATAFLAILVFAGMAGEALS